MSYLGVPRIHFAGRFRADVSTVNNNPSNFGQSNPQDLSWNPYGSGSFDLIGCKITSAVRADGTIALTAAEDPVVGLSLSQIGQARLVDLDTEQQLVSQIWALRLRLDGSSSSPAFSGKFKVTAFSDLWFSRAQVPGGGDFKMSAFFHSVLSDTVWSEAVDSPLLRDLQRLSVDGLLSIKFNVDGFDQAQRVGRIVGAIGPALADEPEHFIRGRHCMPIDDRVPIYFFPAVVDANRGKLIADLGNALPTIKPGDQVVPTLNWEVGTISGDGTFASLGRVPIGGLGWYEQTAGICEFPQDRALSSEESQRLRSTPIAVRRRTPDGRDQIIAHEGDGLHVRAETFVYRMSAGEHSRVILRAGRFGEPLADAEVSIFYNNIIERGPTNGPPASGLSFPLSVTTDAQGTAIFEVSANPIGRPRNSIDGQLYGIDYRLAQADRRRTYQSRWSFISLLLWSKLEVPNEPTWWDHVQPIFKQYAALYPVMKDIIDLADYDDVVDNKQQIAAAFLVPEDSTSYMPVTRDLSPAKRQMILSWFETTGNAGRPNLGTPPVVAAAPMEAPAAVTTEEARADPGGKTMALERLRKRSEGQTS